MSTYEDAPGAADPDNTEAAEPASADEPPDGREIDPTETPDGTNVSG